MDCACLRDRKQLPRAMRRFSAGRRADVVDRLRPRKPRRFRNHHRALVLHLKEPFLKRGHAVERAMLLAEDALRAAIPLGRAGKAEEVAEAVAFLLQADYITGVVLRVDGGMAM